MAGTCQLYTRVVRSRATLVLPSAFLECPFPWLLNTPAADRRTFPSRPQGIGSASQPAVTGGKKIAPALLGHVQGAAGMEEWL